jgi:mxaJ protein
VGLRSALSVVLVAAFALSCARELPRSTRTEPVLRICADPNNMPFSSERTKGFELEIAELVAEDLGARLETTWWPQRRGFFRQTLGANACDVVIGVPKALDAAKTTKPYYRSTYVFVTRVDVGPISSFDDVRLRTLRVGVPVGGDDGYNPPPAHALARRGIVENVHGYSLFGDYATDDPPLAILRALDAHEIDVAIVWGPFAGWYARKRADLLVTKAAVETDGTLPLAYSIAMGVRRKDDSLRAQLDDVLERRRADIDAILDHYGVPR